MLEAVERLVDFSLASTTSPYRNGGKESVTRARQLVLCRRDRLCQLTAVVRKVPPGKEVLDFQRGISKDVCTREHRITCVVFSEPCRA